MENNENQAPEVPAQVEMFESLKAKPKSFEQKFDEEFANLKELLIRTQSQLDVLARSAENMVNARTLPTRYTNRVRIGEVTANFSTFAGSVFDYNQKLIDAVAKEIKKQKGESSES